MTTLRELLPALSDHIDRLDNFRESEASFRKVESERLHKAYTREQVLKMANVNLGKYDQKAKTKAEAIEDLVDSTWSQGGPAKAQRDSFNAAENEARPLLVTMQQMQEQCAALRRSVASLQDSATNALTTMKDKGYLPTSHYARYGSEVETDSALVQSTGRILDVLSQGSATIRTWATDLVKADDVWLTHRGFPSVRLLIEMVQAEDSLNQALATLGETLDSLA